MNTKSFLVSAFAGFVINFVLGAVFYAFLFPDLYPSEGEEKMSFIALGCLLYGILVAYVLTVVASVKNVTQGFKIGAIFGLLNGLSMNFFMYSSLEPNYQNIAIDVVISMVMVGTMGAVIAMLHKKFDA